MLQSDFSSGELLLKFNGPSHWRGRHRGLKYVGQPSAELVTNFLSRILAPAGDTAS
jgi:hypothetical protein